MILEVSEFDLHASSCALDGPVNSLYPRLESVCPSGMSAISTGTNGQKNMFVLKDVTLSH